MHQPNNKNIINITGRAGWLSDTVVERQPLTGELSVSCARPAADG